MHGALHQVRSFNLTRARLGIPPDSIIRDPALALVAQLAREAIRTNDERRETVCGRLAPGVLIALGS
jgi:hypothetical protein